MFVLVFHINLLFQEYQKKKSKRHYENKGVVQIQMSQKCHVTPPSTSDLGHSPSQVLHALGDLQQPA